MMLSSRESSLRAEWETKELGAHRNDAYAMCVNELLEVRRLLCLIPIHAPCAPKPRQ